MNINSDTLFYIFLGIIGLFLAGIIFALIESIFFLRAGHSFTAQVVERNHESQRIGNGIGTTVGANGNVGSGLVTTYSSEKWVIIVKSDLRGVEAVDVDKNSWANFKTGDTVRITPFLGNFSKIIEYDLRIEK